MSTVAAVGNARCGSGVKMGWNAMRFLTGYSTDIGTRKNTNQDSLLIQTAVSKRYGEIALAVICDGMGGLAKGELASAVVIQAMAEWFRNDLPALLEAGFAPEALKEQWDRIIKEQDRRISSYGYEHRLSMGTTISALLIIGQNYYIANVGDTRIYLLTDQIYQLTKDQTLVQREIDQGRLTPQQAAVDPRRSVLLQCIGATEGVAADFRAGTLTGKQVFLICCDGFRHVINPEEFYQALHYRALTQEAQITRILDGLVQLNIQRGETDNITAIALRVD